MATRIPVSVTYNAQNHTLEADPQTVILENPDDWVHWFIAEGTLVPAGASLEILFEHPLGPFQTVRSFDPLNLAAKGNIGLPVEVETATFNYSLFLIPSDPTNQDLVTGGPFVVENQSQNSNFSPWLTVTFDESLNPTADPPQLLLFEGDVAFCEVVGLSEDHLVGFRFADPPHFPGPFPTYFTTRAGGQGNRRLYVANFGDETGTRNYVVQVWDQDGHLVGSTDDPSVDSLGKPPGT